MREKYPGTHWAQMYQLAETFYHENGHLLIPRDHLAAGQPLGAWIGTQRWDFKHRTNSMFTQERIDRLNAIGMVWDVSQKAWDVMYICCRAYVKAYGDLRVPQAYVTVEGRCLGIWLNQQRIRKKEGKLLAARVQRLEELHIIWEPEKLRRSQWDANFNLLEQYLTSVGDILVPTDYITPSGIKLGIWLSNQRTF